MPQKTVSVFGSLGSGIGEVTEDGVTGILHPVGDTASMAQSAIDLLSDPERHKRFRENSLKRARDNFTDKRIVDHYERYYQEILSGAPVPVG